MYRKISFVLILTWTVVSGGCDEGKEITKSSGNTPELNATKQVKPRFYKSEELQEDYHFQNTANPSSDFISSREESDLAPTFQDIQGNFNLNQTRAVSSNKTSQDKLADYLKSNQTSLRSLGRPLGATAITLAPAKLSSIQLGGWGKLGAGFAVGCLIDGTIAWTQGQNPVIGCIDGVLLVSGPKNVPIMELDDGITLPFSDPALKKNDELGRGFRDSTIDLNTGKINDGPYAGLCLALRDDYLSATDCP